MSAELEALFSSSARVEILSLFLLNPNRRFYQREIEREAGQPIRAVQREVKRLAEIDMLCRTTEGNRIFYSLNPGFPMLEELTALFQRASGVVRAAKVAGPIRTLPPEPSSVRQPFPWMETGSVPPFPPRLRRLQVEGEWDQAY